MTERDAYIILNMIQGIGPIRMAALLQDCESASGVFLRDEETLSRINGISPILAKRIVSWQDTVNLDAELELADKAGVTILSREDHDYPEILRQIHDAPLCLYVRGTLPDNLNQKSIAMVGTRNMSHYGTIMAKHLAESAGYAGWTVVSGLACGIDTVAHSGILEVPGAETVAVLGGGLMRIHPQENLGLARRISENGAVISEFPMQFSPTRNSFPRRNRIISGLSLGTLVVEAGLNSGSLITATLALEQGRRVFAVPGQADHANANGCNKLIRQGAVLVESFEHVLEEFDFLPGFESPPMRASEPGQQDNLFSAPMDSENFLGLSSLDLAILDCLKKGDANVDELSATLSQYPPGDIISALIGLEILSKAKKMPDGRYQRLR